MIRRAFALAMLVVLAAPLPGSAEIRLPAGFTTKVHVTGEGFDGAGSPAVTGFPSTSTLAFGSNGVLYLARTGRRYGAGGEEYDLTRVYRIPPTGARLTPATESRFVYGPPLHNPQVAAVHGGDVFVSTFEVDRKVGVFYRIREGRAELLAGGTPERGAPPQLSQPEGAAVDAAGNVYVADRQRGVVMKLDPTGRVIDPSYLTIRRPRGLLMDANETLWVASDGDADAPWQRGQGELLKVTGKDTASVVMRGVVAAGIALAPGGHVFVADRHGGKIHVVARDGTTAVFATFSDGDAPRGLTFAPSTPETRAAGIAGELFVVTIRRAAWSVNEVLRISGPFDDVGRLR